MLHDVNSFGHNTDRAGWRLRAIQKRRREAKQAAIIAAAVTVACALGAGICDRFGNVGGAILLGICAACALAIGTVAAGEA